MFKYWFNSYQNNALEIAEFDDTKGNHIHVRSDENGYYTTVLNDSSDHHFYEIRNANGKIWESWEINNENLLRDGKHVRYNNDGSRQEYNFKNDELNGLMTAYDATNQVDYRNYFVDGWKHVSEGISREDHERHIDKLIELKPQYIMELNGIKALKY